MSDGGRHTYMKLAEDKLYYDEKRKRFVNTANIPGHAHRAYYNNHFKHVSSTASQKLAESQLTIVLFVLHSNAQISTATRGESSTSSSSTASSSSVR